MAGSRACIGFRPFLWLPAMAIYTMTVRVLDQFGNVCDVRQAPFFVLDPGQGDEDAERELLDAAEQLEKLAQEIAEARFDRGHRHHHWWMP